MTHESSGGMGSPFFGCTRNSTVGGGDEWCTSGITPIGWKGTTVGYLVGVVVQGIAPFGWEGPGLHGVRPVGWEGVTMGVMVRGVTPMGWVGDRVSRWSRASRPCNRRGPQSSLQGPVVVGVVDERALSFGNCEKKKVRTIT